MSIEVNGNNSTTTMPGLEEIAELVSPGTSHPAEKLARALWAVSYATLFLGVKAGLHLPGAATGSVFAGHVAAYYGVVAFVLATVPVEMATAFWLPRCGGGHSFHAFADALWWVAVLLLLLVSAMGGFQLTLRV